MKTRRWCRSGTLREDDCGGRRLLRQELGVATGTPVSVSRSSTPHSTTSLPDRLKWTKRATPPEQHQDKVQPILRPERAIPTLVRARIEPFFNPSHRGQNMWLAVWMLLELWSNVAQSPPRTLEAMQRRPRIPYWHSQQSVTSRRFLCAGAIMSL